MRCYKCGGFTAFKVIFEYPAKTTTRFMCTTCLVSLDTSDNAKIKVVVYK